MGRLPGQACEARLTAPLWHDGALGALAPGEGRPIAWSVRLDSEAAAAALRQAPHTDLDLADFAAAPDAGNRLLRRRLSRAVISRITGAPPAAILFGRTPEGAPSVLSPKGWHVSVAGQAPLCLIGAAQEPIGVDAEPDDGGAPLWDMLAPGEEIMLAPLPPELRSSEWLRRWTAKEAHAKRLGFARRADPAAIVTRPTGMGELACRSPEGVSLCYTREVGGRIETVALEGSD